MMVGAPLGVKLNAINITMQGSDIAMVHAAVQIFAISEVGIVQIKYLHASNIKIRYQSHCLTFEVSPIPKCYVVPCPFIFDLLRHGCISTQDIHYISDLE